MRYRMCRVQKMVCWARLHMHGWQLHDVVQLRYCQRLQHNLAPLPGTLVGCSRRVGNCCLWAQQSGRLAVAHLVLLKQVL